MIEVGLVKIPNDHQNELGGQADEHANLGRPVVGWEIVGRRIRVPTLTTCAVIAVSLSKVSSDVGVISWYYTFGRHFERGRGQLRRSCDKVAKEVKEHRNEGCVSDGVVEVA